VEKAPHTFNLQKTMNKNVIEACDVSSWSPPAFQSDESNYYRDIFAKLSAISEKELFTLTPSPDNSKNILRISIHNLGSLLWVNEAEENGSKLTQFLLALRSLARQHLFVCVVTISQDSLASLEMQNASLPRIRSLCDIVIQLKPFSKNERKNGLYKDHHGVMVTNIFIPLRNLSLCEVQFVSPKLKCVQYFLLPINNLRSESFSKAYKLL
jgi:hypothetical protein